MERKTKEGKEGRRKGGSGGSQGEREGRREQAKKEWRKNGRGRSGYKTLEQASGKVSAYNHWFLIIQWGFPGGSDGKGWVFNAGDSVRSLGQKDPLEKEMTTHSGIPAWRIPRTEEPGGLQSMGLQRVGHDWVTNTFTFIMGFWCPA